MFSQAIVQMTHLYPFKGYSPLRHPEEIEDDKMDGGEAEERDEGEGCEHLFGREGTTGWYVNREYQPHDHCDWHNHEAKVTGSDERSLEDDAWFTPEGIGTKNSKKQWPKWNT